MESWWNEEAKSKVEEPIANGGKSHSGCTSLERPHFSSIDPSDGRECESVNDDEKVGEGDDGVGWVACDTDRHVRVAVEAIGVGSTIATQHASYHELADSHTQSTENQERASPGFVDVEEDDRGEDNKQRVLYTGCDQVDVSL